MVEKHDIMFEILHTLHPMHQSEALKTVTSSPIFYQNFSVDHVIITTIIITACFRRIKLLGKILDKSLFKINQVAKFIWLVSGL